MSFSLDSIFTTRTALPKERFVTEIVPTPPLRQYVRCFWKYCGNPKNVDLRIIPDCCSDIIIPLDGNPSIFVGLSDSSFISRYLGDVFCIRFYAWAIAPFLHINPSELFNNAVTAESLVKKIDILQNELIEAQQTEKQVELAEKFLSELFAEKACSDVMNSLFFAINNNCRVTVSSLSDFFAVSRRTLERKFIDNVGVAPKTMIELLRYQLLWQECIKKEFSAADCAFRLGFYDEAHMYNDFSRFHGVGLGEARAEYEKLSHFYNT